MHCLFLAASGFLIGHGATLLPEAKTSASVFFFIMGYLSAVIGGYMWSNANERKRVHHD